MGLKNFHRYYRQVIAPRGGVDRATARYVDPLNAVGHIDRGRHLDGSRRCQPKAHEPRADSTRFRPKSCSATRASSARSPGDGSRFRSSVSQASKTIERKSCCREGLLGPKEASPLAPKGKRTGSETGKGKDKGSKDSAEASKVVPVQN